MLVQLSACGCVIYNNCRITSRYSSKNKTWLLCLCLSVCMSVAECCSTPSAPAIWWDSTSLAQLSQSHFFTGVNSYSVFLSSSFCHLESSLMMINLITTHPLFWSNRVSKCNKGGPLLWHKNWITSNRKALLLFAIYKSIHNSCYQ